MNATERYTRDGKTATVRTREDRVIVTVPGKPTETLVSTNAGITARQITKNLVRDGYARKGNR